MYIKTCKSTKIDLCWETFTVSTSYFSLKSLVKGQGQITILLKKLNVTELLTSGSCLGVLCSNLNISP